MASFNLQCKKRIARYFSLTFLVLDLGLDVLDGVRWLYIEGDGLASQGLDEDLHGTFFASIAGGLLVVSRAVVVETTKLFLGRVFFVVICFNLTYFGAHFSCV